MCAAIYAATNDTLAAAQQMAAKLLGVTNVVLLEDMLDAATLRQADERQEVRMCVDMCACERNKKVFLYIDNAGAIARSAYRCEGAA